MFVNVAMIMAHGIEAPCGWLLPGEWELWGAPWGGQGCPVPPPSREQGRGTALEIGISVGIGKGQEGSWMSAHGSARLSGHVAGQGRAGMGAGAMGRGKRAWGAKPCLWVLPRP